MGPGVFVQRSSAMSQVRNAKDGLVREADGFEGVEHTLMTALILGAILAALVSIGVALNGDLGSLTQVIHF
jgi:Flp pilus assembly pilin Flp